MKNQYTERMTQISDNELFDVIANRNDYLPEAFAAASAETDKRGGKWELSNRVQEENKLNQRLFGEQENIDDTFTTLSYIVALPFVLVALYLGILLHNKFTSFPLGIFALLFIRDIRKYIETFLRRNFSQETSL